MRFTFIIALSSLIGLAATTPHSGDHDDQHDHSGKPQTACSLKKAKIPLAGTTLSVPNGVQLEYVALGTGTQNYTCSDAGTYVSIGALAKLYDASCEIDTIASIEAKKPGSCESGIDQVKKALGRNPVHLGDHYFINNPTGAPGTSPVFDFRASEKGYCDAFVVVAKTAGVAALSNPASNVDWLLLTAATVPEQGTLATDVFRVLTVGGQPPKSCTPGSAPIAVPYAATYWFYK